MKTKKLNIGGKTIEHIDMLFGERLRSLEEEIRRVFNAVKRNPRSKLYYEVAHFVSKLEHLSVNWQYFMYSIYNASARKTEVEKELNDLLFDLEVLENEWQEFKEKHHIGLIIL